MEGYPWRRAVIVGASSGIGEALARQLAQSGASVALLARRLPELQAICDAVNQGAGEGRARAYTHDVRDWRSVPALFQEIVTTLDGLDLIVYAAGIMPRVGRNEYPTSVDAGTIETNLTGAIAWLNEAAHRFSVAGEGTIIGLSSVAGDRGRVGNPAYNASKAGLDTYLEALRARLARRGVTVLTAKPGYVRTPLIAGLPLPSFLPVPGPDDVAPAILRVAVQGRRVAYVPPWWRYIMAVVKAMPSAVMERTNF